MVGSSRPVEEILRRRAVGTACLVALIAFAWMTYRFNWLVDDAFISFRYAKHLAEGCGLRYNPGLAPPTEGYSNFLWVIVLALAAKLGLPAEVASRCLSVSCGALLVWRVTRFIGMRTRLRPIPLIVCAVFLATSPPVAVWATSGLATLPYVLLTFLAFELLPTGENGRRGLGAGIAYAALVLIRVDGMLWVAGLIILAVLRAWVLRDRRAFRPIILCTGIAAATLIALTIFRLTYFGWPLPNTVYAKVGLSVMAVERGGKYVLGFLLAFPHLMPIMVAGAVAARNRHVLDLGHQAALIAACVLGYAVLAGGDWMAMGRLLVPALPFIAILLGLVFGRIASDVGTLACGVVVVAMSLLPAYNLHVVPHALRERLPFRYNSPKFASEYEQWMEERDLTHERAALGRALKQHTRPGETLVCVAIGAVGYYSEMFVYDRAGLVNAEVAHRPAPRRRYSAGHDKVVPPTFFEKQQPTYYWAKLAEIRNDPSRPMKPGQRFRFRGPARLPFQVTPDLEARYELIGIPLSAGQDSATIEVLMLYRRARPPTGASSRPDL